MREVYPENFMVQSGFADDPSEITIGLLYFSFTSLSTVGFGDYHPKNDIERICCAFILLFGVAIFSIVMQNFIDILTSLNEFEAELGDGDELTKFFGTIRKFNSNTPIDFQFKEKIE